jgi:hypothetical protein
MWAVIKAGLTYCADENAAHLQVNLQCDGLTYYADENAAHLQSQHAL